MLVLKMQQRTPEWYAVKKGRISASTMSRVIGGNISSWTRYADVLDGVGESSGYKSYGMSRGVELEKAALGNYHFDNPGTEVEQVGFVIHGDYDWIGASPDGLILPRGGIEIKCPLNPQNHIDTLANGMPDAHYPQVQACIWTCETEWWDFISYDPRTVFEDRMYVQRIYRDEKFIKNMERKCLSFYDFWKNRKETPVASATAVPKFF